MNRSILFISYLSLFSLGFIDNARGPIYPLILKDLSLTFSAGSMFFTIASIFGLLVNLFSKSWLNKFGAFRPLKAFAIFQLVGNIGIGLNPNSFTLIIFFSALYGISLGGTGIAINILVAETTDLKYRRRALSGMHSMYAIASIISPLMVSYLILNDIKWNIIFLYFSIFPFLFLISTFLRTGYSHESVNKILLNSVSLSKKIKLSAILAPYVAAEIIISSRLPLFLTKHFEYSVERSSTYLGIFFSFLFLGRLLFAIKKFQVNTLPLLKCSLIFSLIFYLLGLFNNPLWFTLCGLSMSFFFPYCLEYFSELYPTNIHEITSFSMISIGVFLISMHAIFGIFSQAFGIFSSFSLGILLLMISITSLFTLKIKKI